MTLRSDSRHHPSARDRIVMAVSIAIIVLFLFLLVLGVNLNLPPFPLERMDRLTVGMSKTEVQAMLGEPDSSWSDCWAYSRLLSWPIVYVYFDEHGCYKEWRYDF